MSWPEFSKHRDRRFSCACCAMINMGSRLLTEKEWSQLGDILDSRPVAYGLDSAVWISPMIAWVIEQEFHVSYHPVHVRRLLYALEFSVQRPRRLLARANASEQNRWH